MGRGWVEIAASTRIPCVVQVGQYYSAPVVIFSAPLTPEPVLLSLVVTAELSLNSTSVLSN